jgi:hypothetical protein
MAFYGGIWTPRNKLIFEDKIPYWNAQFYPILPLLTL